VTLEDVARTSGVSRATASRALNGRARVAPDVRARVTMIARSLGYRPNLAARSLVSGRADIIGLVLPTGHIVDQPYEARVLEAVAEAATDAGQGVMLWLAAREPSAAVRDQFRAGVVDGLVISGVVLGAGWVEDLFDGPHPCVLLGRHPHRTDVTTVEIDNGGGVRRAIELLAAGGHRRVAMIGGPAGRVDAIDREAAFRESLHARGLPIDEQLFAPGDFNVESGHLATRRLLAHRPDAIFAANDLMAVGALQAIREAGLAVPGDVAVVGFDDLPQAQTADPPLTTVRHDIDAVCLTAVETLLRLIDAQTAADSPPVRETAVVPTPLVIRSSTRRVDGSGVTNEAWEARPSHTSTVTPTSVVENRRATS
jgi:LacI family transcriptional regulator